jgi:hypothetical protein
MTTTDQAKTAILHFPYSSIQFIADSNQCQHLSDECIKYLTLEATGVVRFLLQVDSRSQEKYLNWRFPCFRMH